MWYKAGRSSRWNIRRLCTAARRRIEDEGDWIYSSEWWGTESDRGYTVLRSASDKGNGVISVLAYPSSRPSRERWPEMERWLQQRFAEIHPSYGGNERFRVLGYQWRTLRFNDDTRQSTVKVMAACRESEPGFVCFMQQAYCLAVPCKFHHYYYDKLAVSHSLNNACKCHKYLCAFYISQVLSALAFLLISILCSASSFNSISYQTPLVFKKLNSDDMDPS